MVQQYDVTRQALFRHINDEVDRKVSDMAETQQRACEDLRVLSELHDHQYPGVPCHDCGKPFNEDDDWERCGHTGLGHNHTHPIHESYGEVMTHLQVVGRGLTETIRLLARLREMQVHHPFN